MERNELQSVFFLSSLSVCLSASNSFSTAFFFICVYVTLSKGDPHVRLENPSRSSW